MRRITPPKEIPLTLLSFDIEISDIFELGEQEDFEDYEPLHISVAATALHGGEEKVWYSQGADGVPVLSMTPQRAHELLEYLDEMQQNNMMVRIRRRIEGLYLQRSPIDQGSKLKQF